MNQRTSDTFSIDFKAEKGETEGKGIGFHWPELAMFGDCPGSDSYETFGRLLLHLWSGWVSRRLIHPLHRS